jgi:hypothetical protein
LELSIRSNSIENGWNVNDPVPYKEAFPIGVSVRVANRASLESFMIAWHYHHKLQPEQLRYAGRVTTVEKVGFYHGEPRYINWPAFRGVGSNHVWKQRKTAEATAQRREETEMLALEDPLWRTLLGGYRTPYDASIVLRALEAGADPGPIWNELWGELHHQGDVGEASYAAIPHLIDICRKRQIDDWNLFALASTIEICRLQPKNPTLPSWLEHSYRNAWQGLFEFGLDALRSSDDEEVIKSALGVIALHKGLLHLGRLLAESDLSELRELSERFH